MNLIRPTLLCLAALAGSALLAEDAVLRQSAVLRADRSIVSLKAGTTVEVVSRDGDKVTIKYKNLTGTIAADRLDEPKVAEAKPASAPTEPKPAEPKPAEPKPKEVPPASAAPARPPQTTYGKAVQKAKDNAAAHDKNLAKPADEIMK